MCVLVICFGLWIYWELISASIETGVKKRRLFLGMIKLMYQRPRKRNDEPRT